MTTTSENLKAAQNADIGSLGEAADAAFRVCDLCGKLRKDALVLSIIAGARIESIAQGLKHASIVRSMPNTPAQVAEGMTVWTSSTAVTPTQRDEAQAILRAFGKELYVADEAFLDMATAISGRAQLRFSSGSADSKRSAPRFSREDARTLVTKTVRGSCTRPRHPFASGGDAHRVTSRRPAHTRCISSKSGFRTCCRRQYGRVPAQRTLSRSTALSAVRREDEPNNAMNAGSLPQKKRGVGRL